MSEAKSGWLGRLLCRLFHVRHHQVVDACGKSSVKCRCSRCGTELEVRAR